MHKWTEYAELAVYWCDRAFVPFAIVLAACVEWIYFAEVASFRIVTTGVLHFVAMLLILLAFAWATLQVRTPLVLMSRRLRLELDAVTQRAATPSGA
jgi:hypothetical protein